MVTVGIQEFNYDKCKIFQSVKCEVKYSIEVVIVVHASFLQEFLSVQINVEVVQIYYAVKQTHCSD